MTTVKFALYAPGEPSLPWLAVTLRDGRVIDSFACRDRMEAQRILVKIQARMEAVKRPQR